METRIVSMVFTTTGNIHTVSIFCELPCQLEDAQNAETHMAETTTARLAGSAVRYQTSPVAIVHQL